MPRRKENRSLRVLFSAGFQGSNVSYRSFGWAEQGPGTQPDGIAVCP